MTGSPAVTLTSCARDEGVGRVGEGKPGGHIGVPLDMLAAKML